MTSSGRLGKQAGAVGFTACRPRRVSGWAVGKPRAKKRTPKKAAPAKRAVSSADWSPAFLAHLRETANVRESCKKAGVARSVAYDRRANDPQFAAAWSDAVEDAVDELEQTARRRALESSDTLIIFLLKSHRPSVYRDRIEVDAKNRLVIEEEVVGGDAHPQG